MLMNSFRPMDLPMTARLFAVSLAAALACWLSPVAAAQGGADLEALKAQAATGDAGARVALVQELLMSLPAGQGRNEPLPDLFAAKCWWDGFDRWAAVDAGALSSQRVAEIDDAFRRRDADLRLAPGVGMAQAEADALRWGEAADDRFGARHRAIQDSLPATGPILFQLAQDRNVDAALSRAEALDWNRPETHALIAQLRLMAGDHAGAVEAANTALALYRGHYGAHAVLAQIEFGQLRSTHACDSAIAWERLMQADTENSESLLVLQTLLGLYDAQPDAARLDDLRDRVRLRVSYHERAAAERAEAAAAPGGEARVPLYRPYLSDAQLAELRTLLARIDQARGAGAP